MILPLLEQPNVGYKHLQRTSAVKIFNGIAMLKQIYCRCGNSYCRRGGTQVREAIASNREEGHSITIKLFSALEMSMQEVAGRASTSPGMLTWLKVNSDQGPSR